MCQLVAQCPPLDLNSTYLYLLLAEHFAHTCLVAEDAYGLAGMVSAYRPPQRPAVLFVWQVAVHPRARGQRLGLWMLHQLLQRDNLAGIQWIEATVDPGNGPSRRLFSRLAASLGAPLNEMMMFTTAHFGCDAHAAEPLLRIGPYDQPVAA